MSELQETGCLYYVIFLPFLFTNYYVPFESNVLKPVAVTVCPVYVLELLYQGFGFDLALNLSYFDQTRKMLFSRLSYTTGISLVMTRAKLLILTFFFSFDIFRGISAF